MAMPCAIKGFVLCLAALFPGPLQAAAVLRCPAELPSAHEGFEQVGPTPPTPKRLDGLRLFDGLPGEEAKAAPAELAPDRTKERGRSRLTAVWQLSGNGELLVVCTYRGSETHYRASPRPIPQSCTMERSAGHAIAYCE